MPWRLSAQTPGLTCAEFAPLPERAGGARDEITGGNLFVAPAPGTWHFAGGYRVAEAPWQLRPGVPFRRVLVGPVDMLFAERDCLEPDLLSVVKGRRTLLSDRSIEDPPDLGVEVKRVPTRLGYRPWHFLYFFPLPHQQGSFLPGSFFTCTGRCLRSSSSPRFVASVRGSGPAAGSPDSDEATEDRSVRALRAIPNSSTAGPAG